MKVTVLICTFNRFESLVRTLENVTASTLPASWDWEVLVVDNNSNDQTREAVNGFCVRYPGRFRYLFEPQPGLSNARNAGLRAAHGDVLAFTDDDVTVSPDWLHNLTAGLMDRQWAGAGGRTLPAQPFSPPEWLAKTDPFQWGGVLGGLFDLGDKAVELHMAPYGTNMAFRKQMFELYGEFRVDLGRRHGNLMGCEDTEFGNRLIAAGERLRYEPLAVAYHPIQDSRVNKQYFLDWWFDYGRSSAREEGLVSPAIAGLKRYVEEPARISSQLAGLTLHWLQSPNPHLRFYRKCQVWKTVGKLREVYGK